MGPDMREKHRANRPPSVSFGGHRRRISMPATPPETPMGGYFPQQQQQRDNLAMGVMEAMGSTTATAAPNAMYGLASPTFNQRFGLQSPPATPTRVGPSGPATAPTPTGPNPFGSFGAMQQAQLASSNHLPLGGHSRKKSSKGMLGHRRMSTASIIRLASHSRIFTPTKALALFAIVFTATYLGGLVSRMVTPARSGVVYKQPVLAGAYGGPSRADYTARLKAGPTRAPFDFDAPSRAATELPLLAPSFGKQAGPSSMPEALKLVPLDSDVIREHPEAALPNRYPPRRRVKAPAVDTTTNNRVRLADAEALRHSSADANREVEQLLSSRHAAVAAVAGAVGGKGNKVEDEDNEARRWSTHQAEEEIVSIRAARSASSIADAASSREAKPTVPVFEEVPRVEAVPVEDKSKGRKSGRRVRVAPKGEARRERKQPAMQMQAGQMARPMGMIMQGRLPQNGGKLRPAGGAQAAGRKMEREDGKRKVRKFKGLRE